MPISEKLSVSHVLGRTCAAAAVVGTAVVGVAVSSGPAAAASCTAGPTVAQPNGESAPSVTCPTWTGTPLWYYPYVLDGMPDGAEGQAGYLYAGQNWVVCQFYGDANPQYGGYHNHYWLLTQGDVGYDSDAWGYLPATAVGLGADEQPIPGVPLCHGGWY